MSKKYRFIILFVILILTFGFRFCSLSFFPAFSGTLIVFFVYLLSEKLFKNSRVALIASFLLATSPWFIFSPEEKIGLDSGIISRYLAYFSPVYFFIEGNFNIRYSGLFYEFLLPFFFLGIYMLIKKRRLVQQVIFFWLFLGPIPAVLTFNKVGIFNMIVPMVIIIGLGIDKFLIWLNSKPRFIAAICCLLFAICYLYSFARCLDSYYVHSAY